MVDFSKVSLATVDRDEMPRETEVTGFSPSIVKAGTAVNFGNTQSYMEYDEDEDFVSADFVIPKIRTLVISCGNAGGNIVKHIVMKNSFGDVEYVMTDTDYMALNAKKISGCKRMLLGEKTCRGLGAGMHPETAQLATEESETKIRNLLKDANLVFLIAGEGGGSGTGCSPVIAKIAKEEGAIVIAMVTKPFKFEGKIVMNRAISGIKELRKEVDAIEIIDNQKVGFVINPKKPAYESLEGINEFIGNMVGGFVNVTRDTSTIKLDFQDLRKTLEECKGDMFIGVGESRYALCDNEQSDENSRGNKVELDANSDSAQQYATSGEQAMMEAVERAISCPLIDGVNMHNAKGVISLYLVGKDIPLEVIEKAQELINDKIGDNANVILGADFDEKMNGRIKVFFIVAGLNSESDSDDDSSHNSYANSGIMEKGERIPMFTTGRDSVIAPDKSVNPDGTSKDAGMHHQRVQQVASIREDETISTNLSAANTRSLSKNKTDSSSEFAQNNASVIGKTDINSDDDTSYVSASDTQVIVPVSEMMVNEDRVQRNKAGNIYGLPSSKAAAVESRESDSDRNNIPSIYGFEKSPDYLRMQCQ